MLVKIIGVIIIIAVLSWFFAGMFLARIVTKPRREPLTETQERERGNGFWAEYEKYPKEEWNIEGYRGYLLHGILLPNTGERYVIITNGYTANRYNSVKYAHIFYELGYSVYIYDLRHHGENADDFCSMGYLERRDIIAIKDAMQARFGKEIQIGLHGESLGCASSILALGLSDEFTFCIADCGYSDLAMLLGYEARHLMKLPAWCVHATTPYMLLAHHCSFYSVKPIDALAASHTPVLFIHGAGDDFILPLHSQRMYEACHGKKRLVFFESAGHAQSYTSNPTRYQSVVAKFLEEIEE